MKITYLKVCVLIVASMFTSCSKDIEINQNTIKNIEVNTGSTGKNSISFTVDGKDVVLKDCIAVLNEFKDSRTLNIQGGIKEENSYAVSIMTDINKLHTDPNIFGYMQNDTAYIANAFDAGLKIDVTTNNEKSFKAIFSGTLTRFDYDSNRDKKIQTKTIENGIIDINGIKHQKLQDYTATESKNILKAKIAGEDVWFYNLTASTQDYDYPEPHSIVFFRAETKKTTDRNISFTFDFDVIDSPKVNNFSYSEGNISYSLNEKSENASIDFKTSMNDDKMIKATFSGIFSRMYYDKDNELKEETIAIEEGYIEYYY